MEEGIEIERVSKWEREREECERETGRWRESVRNRRGKRIRGESERKRQGRERDGKRARERGKREGKRREREKG